MEHYVLLACNNNLTARMVENVYVKNVPDGHVHKCKGVDIVNTYKRLCQLGMRPNCIITDDLTTEYARQLKSFDDDRNYIWIVGHSIVNSTIIYGLRSGVIDFLRWPASLEEMARIMQKYAM